MCDHMSAYFFFKYLNRPSLLYIIIKTEKTMHNSPRQGNIQRFIIKRTVHNSFCQSQGNIQSFTFFGLFIPLSGNLKVI